MKLFSFKAASTLLQTISEPVFENLYKNDFMEVAFVQNALLKTKGTMERLLSPYQRKKSTFHETTRTSARLKPCFENHGYSHCPTPSNAKYKEKDVRGD